jgi:hypothetical protein
VPGGRSRQSNKIANFISSRASVPLNSRRSSHLCGHSPFEWITHKETHGQAINSVLSFSMSPVAPSTFSVAPKLPAYCHASRPSTLSRHFRMIRIMRCQPLSFQHLQKGPVSVDSKSLRGARIPSQALCLQQLQAISQVLILMGLQSLWNQHLRQTCMLNPLDSALTKIPGGGPTTALSVRDSPSPNGPRSKGFKHRSSP